MPVKHFDAHAAMYTHSSQPTGAGAVEGQHGISSAISLVIAAGDVSCAITAVELSTPMCAITGCETGVNASPAIITIATSRRMANLHCTRLSSHRLAAKGR